MGQEWGDSKAYFGSFGDAFAKNLNFDVTEGRMESDGHFSGQKQTLFQFKVNLCRMSESLVNRGRLPKVRLSPII